MLKNKKNILKYTTILAGIVVVFLLIQFNISKADNVDFYVNAKIPGNQVDTTKTYFDLLSKPGQKQKLEVEVYNEKSEEIIVKIATNTAITNSNGVIDYNSKDAKDEGIKNSFSEIATVENEEVVIPGNSSKVVVVDVTMPEDEYDGIILGGIVITKKENDKETSKEETGKSEEKNQIAIKNEYSYVIGVKLVNKETVVEPDFKFIKVEPKLVDYRGAMVQYIQNTQPTIVKDLNVDVIVTNVKNDEKYVELNKTVEMAPNSTMGLPAYPENNQLDPGKYKSQVKLTLNDKTWEFEQEFTIESSEARSINKEVPKDKAKIPTYIWIIISGLVVAIIVLVGILYKKKIGNADK